MGLSRCLHVRLQSCDEPTHLSSDLDPLYVLTPSQGTVELLSAPSKDTRSSLPSLALDFNKSVSNHLEIITPDTQFAQMAGAPAGGGE